MKECAALLESTPIIHRAPVPIHRQRAHLPRRARRGKTFTIAPFMATVPIKEGHLDRGLGVIVRSDAMLKPGVRQFIARLRRAALRQNGVA